jgi:hypothetical protein
MSYSKIQSLLNKGISRPTMYRVIIPRIGGEADQQLSLLCKNTAVPEISINTITANGHEAQGVVREVPTNVVYGKPFSITVISDRDYTVYKRMRDWFDSTVSNANPFPSGGGSGGNAQRANFYDSITSDLQLIKLENNGGGDMYSPFTVVFNRAYPIRMGELVMDSAARDQLMEFTVDFYYETYSFTETDLVVSGDL